jgi:pyruvate dehydrogenase E2 component (dihydrolipoamide acetyltransferase)
MIEVRVESMSGEYMDEATVTHVSVAVGALVAEGETLVILETAKASMEVPAPGAGRVSQIHVAVNDDVKVGELLVTLATETSAD